MISNTKQLITKRRNISLLERLSRLTERFSRTEKVIFYVFAILLAVSSLFILREVSRAFLVEVPRSGGVLEEGVIGFPRFINPVLALSDADKDISTLVYSGLLKASSDGELIHDLAESYTVSEDFLTYTFRLKDDIFFHDEKPITAEDVIFTVQKAQDPLLKSPKRGNWEGVTVEAIDEKTVQFTLRQAYAPFLENTTLGILPKHIWKNADTDQFTFSQFNVEPIGSGPYKIKNLKRNSGGIPVLYTLVPFEKYTLGKPYISKLIVKFFSNEEELVEMYRRGAVESIHSISSQTAKTLSDEGATVTKTPLPRVFGVFLNQNQAPIFVHREVRRALNLALDKERIVNEVLHGFGTAINSPIPPGLIPASASSTAPALADKETARELLDSNGWKPNENGILSKEVGGATETLAFSISTSDVPELKDVAAIIKEEWATIGVSVDVKIFETGDLNQNVIRPRKYDALLFGEIIGRDLDFYPFWHSSQRNDPGINIALYTDISVDKLLEDARTTFEKDERMEKYREFEEHVISDLPAVFVYTPDFLYFYPDKIHNVKLGQITVPSERFQNVHEWFIETHHVWKIFTDAR